MLGNVRASKQAWDILTNRFARLVLESCTSRSVSLAPQKDQNPSLNTFMILR
jgi:hypothetical protein